MLMSFKPDAKTAFEAVVRGHAPRKGPLPAPVVEVKDIKRAGDMSGSCNDTGAVSLAIPMPAGYKDGDLGVYLRIVSGKPQGDQMFWNSPYGMFDMENGKALMTVLWLDVRKSRQEPLDLKVEAFFVSDLLELGPSSTFSIKQ